LFKEIIPNIEEWHRKKYSFKELAKTKTNKERKIKTLDK
jgi:hypothetical protein